MFNKKPILIFALSFLISLSAVAALPLVGVAAIAQQVTKTIVQKAIQRGFSPSDPRVQAISKNVNKAINSRLIKGFTTGKAVGLGLVTGGLHFGYKSLTMDGENVNFKQDPMQGIGIADANGVFLTPELLSGMTDFSSLDFSNHDPETKSQIDDFINTLSIYQSYGFSINVEVCGALKDRFCIYVNGSEGHSYQSLFTVGIGQSEAIDISNPAETAAGAIPQDFQDKKLTDAQIAGLVNDLWSDMATTPNYDGVPYQFSNAVTAADVAGAGNSVTVRDFVTPANITLDENGDRVIAPENAFDQSAESTLNETPYGLDPGISSPVVPTAGGGNILSPILGLLPDFRNFSISEGQGYCPEIHLVTDFFDVSTTTHCVMWQYVSPVIHMIMSIVWIFAGIRIVLEA